MSTTLKPVVERVNPSDSVNPQDFEPIRVNGTAEQRERNKALVASLEQQLREIEAMSEQERAAADEEYKKFEAIFRENAMSYRNRANG